MICLIVTVVYLAFFLCRNIRVLNSRSSYGKVLSYDLLSLLFSGLWRFALPRLFLPFALTRPFIHPPFQTLLYSQVMILHKHRQLQKG